MSNGRIVHQLIRTQVTVMTEDDDLEALETYCKLLNHNAMPGVEFSVRTVEVHTRPLRVLPTPRGDEQ